MWKDKYYSSKLPVIYALLFAANLVLFILLEILIIYPYPDQLDASTLEGIDPAYSGCTVISSDRVSELTCYLIETADGQQQIVSTQRHVLGRSKLLKPVAVEGLGDIDLKVGIHTHRIHIANDSVEITFHSYSGTPIRYLIFPALMEAVELLVISFIRKWLQ